VGVALEDGGGDVFAVEESGEAAASRAALSSLRRTTARYSMRRFLIFSSPK
jgi:hypothetical protein